MIRRARNGRFKRNGMPTLHVAMLVIGLSAASASYAYSVRPGPVVVEKTQWIEHQIVQHETLPVPVCAPLPTRKSSREMQAIDTLAAAIPASALMPARMK